MRPFLPFILSLVLAVAVVLAPTSSFAADPEPDAASVESARAALLEGNGHFQAKRFQDALKAFERSFGLVASPNTQLMIARSLRELGRKTDAYKTFDSAAVEAKRRVKAGESKYVQTADAATSEGNALKSQIGTIQVHVVHSAGSTLSVDGKSAPLSSDGDAKILHDPGSVTVVLTDSNGAEQTKTVNVQAGGTVPIEFRVVSSSGTGSSGGTSEEDNKPVVDPNADRHKSSWAWPAAIGAGVVTIAGVGVFAGFGLSSQSTYDDLKNKCGGTCGPEFRGQADEGATAQTIANIGLGVAIVGAVATIIFLVKAVPERN